MSNKNTAPKNTAPKNTAPKNTAPTKKEIEKAQVLAQRQERAKALVDNFSDNVQKIGYELTGDLISYAKDYINNKDKTMLEFLLGYAAGKNDKLVFNSLKKIVFGMSGAFVKIKGAWLFDIEKSTIEKITIKEKGNIREAKIIFHDNQESKCRSKFASFIKAGIENVFRLSYTIENVKKVAAKKSVKVETTNGTVTTENFLQVLENIKKDFQCVIGVNEIINAITSGNYTLGVALSKEAIAEIKKDMPEDKAEN